MECSLDTSDYVRNSDYSPSRFDAQSDAANLVCGAKTGMNPENTVAILTTGGGFVWSFLFVCVFAAFSMSLSLYLPIYRSSFLSFFFPKKLFFLIDLLDLIVQDVLLIVDGFLSLPHGCVANRPKMQVTHTGDLGKILNALSKLEVGGDADIMAAVQVAQVELLISSDLLCKERKKKILLNFFILIIIVDILGVLSLRDRFVFLLFYSFCSFDYFVSFDGDCDIPFSWIL